jgi:hypothetical protein
LQAPPAHLVIVERDDDGGGVLLGVERRDQLGNRPVVVTAEHFYALRTDRVFAMQ